VDPFGAHMPLDQAALEQDPGARPERALGERFATAVTGASPALGWLCTRLGVADIAGDGIRRLFALDDSARPLAFRIIGRAPGTLTTPSLAGQWQLGDREPRIPESDRQTLTIAVTGPELDLQLVIAGDPRPDPRFDPRPDPRFDPRFDPRPDPRFDGREPGIDAQSRHLIDIVERCADTARDAWRRMWRPRLTGDDALQLVERGVHRLLSSKRRAKLVTALQRSICDVARQRAILHVLADSLRRGDGDQVIAELGGPARAARRISWSMDGDRDRRFHQLLEQLERAPR
jgi:hypothetical protein